jgi:hypothetical protein
VRIERGLAIAAVLGVAACGALAGLDPLRFDDEDGGRRIRTDASAVDGSTSICTDALDFCDDFEGPRALSGSWSGVAISGSAVLGIEGGVLRGSISTVDGGDAGHYAALLLDLPWDATTGNQRRAIDARFRARIVRCPGASEPSVTLANISLGTKTLELTVAEQAGQCVAFLRELVIEAGRYRNSTTLLMTVAAWHDVRVALDPAVIGEPERVVFSVDSEARVFESTASTPPARYYQTFGVEQGTLQGTNADVELDDFRLVYLR